MTLTREYSNCAMVVRKGGKLVGNSEHRVCHVLS